VGILAENKETDDRNDKIKKRWDRWGSTEGVYRQGQVYVHQI
jgi:hypothetical protein